MPHPLTRKRSKVPDGSREMSFWDHLEELRGSLFRSVLVLLALSVVTFLFKELLFDKIVLAPARSDFFLYRWLHTDTHLDLVNIEVAAQFMVHIKVSFVAALIISVPYLLFEIWRFVAPALYEKEKRAIRGAFAGASFLFYVGMATGYCLVLPLMVNFFCSYSVSDSIVNTISLSSYISLVSSSVLLFGLVFEFPTIIAALSRLGLVTRRMLLGFWRYAIGIIVIVAALITPSGDPFSLFVVSVPLFLLYCISILLCRKEIVEEKDDID